MSRHVKLLAIKWFALCSPGLPPIPGFLSLPCSVSRACWIKGSILRPAYARPTDRTDAGFERQSHDELLQGLILPAEPFDLCRYFHFGCAFDVLATHRGQSER